MRPRNLSLMAASLLVVASCGGGEATDTTAPPDDDITTTTAVEETTDGVSVSGTDLGSILADPEGFTLYVLTADVDGESTCYDACAGVWPPVPGDTAINPDLDASMFGTTTRTDGSEQLTANGMPLYRYAGDTSPGDTTGQGFNDVWFVVDADGQMIGAAAADTTVIDYSY
jgi:predicted lipoprotein with Yx(FWY)xxD motif